MKKINKAKVLQRARLHHWLKANPPLIPELEPWQLALEEQQHGRPKMPCPVCGSRHLELRIIFADKSRGILRDHSYIWCTDCGYKTGNYATPWHAIIAWDGVVL